MYHIWRYTRKGCDYNMVRTQKQVLDEHSNRIKKNVIDFVRFSKENGCDGYTNVTNITRDGVKITTLKLDSEMHEYEFHAGYNAHPWDKTWKLKWTYRNFYGKVIEIEQDIEE